jgi:ABC-type nitrate/sulfonate/bicarbonate transport system substrate-binding protein
MYWFLVVRSDLGLQAGDIEGLRGLRIAAAPGPDLGLKALLAAHGVDPEAAGLQIAPPAAAPADHSFGVAAAHALAAGQVDGFWANGMGAEVAVRSGTGRVIADARRDGGPAALFTFPALMTTEQLIATEPAAVGAAVRAVMAAQQCLRESPAVAAEIGKRLFPPAEAALIADLVARDADYYSPAISPETVRALNDFACSARLLTGPVSYEQVVAAEFVPLWETARGVAGR